MKKALLFLMITALGLASCQSDGDSGSVIDDGSTLKMRYSMSALNPATRATVSPIEGEETINSIYLLFFDPSSDRSGEYKGYLEVTGPFVMNTDIAVNISSNPALSTTAAYKVLAVANIDQYGPYLGIPVSEWLNQLNGKTESNVYSQMTAFISTGNEIGSDRIFMTGEASKEAGGTGTMQFVFTRGLIRFDVLNNARGSYDLMSVSIWNAFPETSIFGGGLTDYFNKSRIERFYGVVNDNNLPDGNGISSGGDPNGNYYGDIVGGLYSLPNQVVTPGHNDTKTTCLIVGLQQRGTTKTTYHRVNILPEESMQDLKRNNAYRLTISSVSGDGADTEIEAYAGGTNNINYKINNWDLGDNGLIIQNGNVFLALPAKIIRLGAEAQDNSYQVYATGGSPGETITISVAYEGTAGSYMTISQSGNAINIVAQALTAVNEERSATITVRYAGVTATIGVIQSGDTGKYLRIKTPEGSGIPIYPGFPDAPMNGTLTVEASGPWTAELIHAGTQNFFSFLQGSPKIIYNSVALEETLPIFTRMENATGASRRAFVYISLNDDPDNYATVLTLTQKALGSIGVSPSINKIDWDGLGNLLTTGAGAISSKEFRFDVVTTHNGTEYEEWKPVFTSTNSATSAHFDIVAWNYDGTNLANNYITLKTKGEAIDGANNDELQVQLVSSSSTNVKIQLVQTGYTMNLSPGSVSAVSSKGGVSDAISVTSNGSTLKWSAEIKSTTAAGGTMASTHVATLVDGTTGNPVASTDRKDLTTPFKVEFPKIYYGDHKKGVVSAVVEVKLWSGTNLIDTKEYTVTQNPLLPNDVNIVNYHCNESYPYGNLYGTSGFYNYPYRYYLRTLFSTGGSDIDPYPATPGSSANRIYVNSTLILPSSNTKVVPVSSSATYVHMSLPNHNTSNATVAPAITQWRQNNEGVLVIQCELYPHYAAGSGDFSPVMSALGWSSAGHANNRNAKYIRPSTNSKLTDFIFNRGPFGAVDPYDSSVAFYDINTPWYADDSSQALNLGSSDAIAIIGLDGRVSVAIDPVNRVVFFGEGQFWASATGFYNSTINANVTTAKSKLLANICAYVVLTAQYGSSFSDTLVGTK